MKFASLLTGVAVLGVLTPMIAAQTLTSPVPINGTPTYLGTYSMATGEISPPQAGDGDAVVFDNTVGNGFFTSPANTVMMDWGTLSAGGNNFITNIQIGYATGTIGDVDLGIRIHQGATGFGDIGAVVSNLSVTGLPGSVGGEVVAFVVDLDLVGAGLVFNLADGPIGWSYESFDPSTGPLLIGPPNEAGVIDAFDQFGPGLAPYIGTFFFGGVPLASFHCQLTGAAEDPGPECFLLLGVGETHVAFPGDPKDILLVNPLVIMPITIETMAPLPIPNDPTLAGLELYWQVFMNNPWVFPEDNIQLSNGVKTTIGDSALPPQYGPIETMELWSLAPAELGGAVDMSFSIEGM